MTHSARGREGDRQFANIPPMATPPATADQRREELKTVFEQARGCVRCAQLAAERQNVVFGAGNADADLMFVGEAARVSLLAEVERGAYQLQPFSASDIRKARTVIQRYSDLAISLADASIAVLSGHLKTQDVLTLDERHFRVLSANGKPFRLLPADV